MPPILKPPKHLPTRGSTSDEEEWTSLINTQLTDTRKSAENWRTGLVAIIGLITTVSVIKGPDSVSGLDAWVAILVGVLLVLALAAATLGAWWSLSAAYGNPSIITRQAFQDLGGLNGYNFDLASKTIASLRRAQIATIITLVFLVGAIGLTWYGPRSTSVYLEVERPSEPKICGKLASSTDGYMDIDVPATGITRVQLKDITKISAVEECP
jgi:hypothetical protein